MERAEHHLDPEQPHRGTGPGRRGLHARIPVRDGRVEARAYQLVVNCETGGRNLFHEFQLKPIAQVMVFD